MVDNARATIPQAPGALPIIGHARQFLSAPLRFVSELPRYGDVVRMRLGPSRVDFVCDPALTNTVLRDDATFDRGGVLFDRVREIVGEGLGNCPHSEHRWQRLMLQPVFTPAKVREYVPLMAEQIDAVTRGWRDSQVLDVLAETSLITSKTLVATLLSSSLPESVSRAAHDDLQVITNAVTRRMLMPRVLDRLPTPGKRRYDRARKCLRDTVTAIVDDRRSNADDRDDLISTLLAARHPTGRPLTDTEIFDQVVSFFLAGTETTADVLAWAAHLVSTDPGIQARLHAEVDTLPAEFAVTAEDLDRLELTGRIITETLRMYPPLWFLTRTVTADTELGSNVIPAGSTVAYSAYLLHHRPDLYEHPDRFDPDRWLPERAAGIPRNASIPFGTGRRKCIGDGFAVAETTLALATMIRRWQLEPLAGQHVRPARVGMLRPHALRIRVRSRPAAR
ncbi:cytochrome P450 [Nocardia arthritidis]|uniref:cytochrome P450 n=1 Tax=Nocardia arthritidis TaxID=228602 RepID=UPI001EE9B785|nr:cytochrome P450 [Nocardia arthritidis]